MDTPAIGGLASLQAIERAVVRLRTALPPAPNPRPHLYRLTSMTSAVRLGTSDPTTMAALAPCPSIVASAPTMRCPRSPAWSCSISTGRQARGRPSTHSRTWSRSALRGKGHTGGRGQT